MDKYSYSAEQYWPVQGIFLLPMLLFINCFTVKVRTIGTDRSGHTVQTQIRLLHKEQSDQGLHRLPFQQHYKKALLGSEKARFPIFRTITVRIVGVQILEVYGTVLLTLICLFRTTRTTRNSFIRKSTNPLV